MSAAFCAHLAGCTGLTLLTAHGLHQITSGGLAGLAALRHMSQLDLGNVPGLDDDTLALGVAGKRGLRALHVTDAPALRLGRGVFAAGAPELHWLELRRCPAAGAGGLADTDALPALDTVRFEACASIDDACLAALTAHPRLHTLGVLNCPRVTTAGVCRLVGGGAPKWIELGALPGVDRAAVEQAIRACPAAVRPTVTRR